MLTPKDDFTKFLEFHALNDAIQILEEFKTSEIASQDIAKARLQFSQYKEETKRKILNYFHHKYGNIVSKFNGGFFDLIDQNYLRKIDPLYVSEFDSWKQNRLTETELKDIYESIKMVSRTLDYEGKYNSVNV